MKREAMSHTKIKRLCRRMDIPLWQAVGLLESIWLLAGRECPRGDIGKLSNEDIALAIDYRGDESRMIEALVSCGWLEVDPVERLIVHDWPEHADDAVNLRLARTKQYFVRGVVPKMSRLSTKEREVCAQFYQMCAQTKPVSALPEPEPEPEPEPVTHTRSGVRAMRPPVAADLNGHTSKRFEEFWARWPRQTGKDSACHAWCSYVSTEVEELAFACLDRFLASGDVMRGAIPNLGPTQEKPGWLADCARDGWQCDWPKPIVSAKGPISPIEQLRQDIRNGTRKI